MFQFNYLMKTKTFSLFLISVIAAILIAWAPTSAYAGVSNGATIVKDQSCEVHVVGSDGLRHDGVAPTGATILENDKKWIALCMVMVTNPPSQAEIFNGHSCSTVYGPTTNTQLIVKPSGKALFHCIVDVSD